jgi:GLPGLI family protein
MKHLIFKLLGIIKYLAIANIAQSQYIRNYEVTYEKKINMEKLSKWWRSDDKDGKFWKDNFKLTTNSIFSSYARVEKDITEESNWVWGHVSYSQTFIDILGGQQTSQKEVSEKTFLVQDSIPKLQWYMQDEVRTIAGYSCRKAMAKFKDSVIIVAYFTEQLYAPIGPESVTGLPGTILGMVIPMFETTWLATSVTSLELIPPAMIPQPKKGEKMNLKTLEEILQKTYKDETKAYKLVLRVLL